MHSLNTFSLAVVVSITVTLALSAPVFAGENDSPPIVRVNISSQAYDFLQPWRKKAPQTRQGIGAVLKGNNVLVTGELIQNHTYIEIEAPGTGHKTTAEVKVVDYSANLALVSPTDPDFLSDYAPMPLADASTVGDRLAVWQLKSNDALMKTEANLTSVQVKPYPRNDITLLAYQLTTSLQSQRGSFTIPLIKKNKLAGVVTRFNPEKQKMSAIPVDVIAHFLKDAADGQYNGFPRIGLSLASTRDPQFRHYLGLPDHNKGVYVSSVTPGSPAEEAGIKKGDVILKVAGFEVDQNGHYKDPVYGKIAMSNLITLKCQTGETISLHIRSEEGANSIELSPAPKQISDYVSPPYLLDTAPRFAIVGGVVIQQLSRQYLYSWGKSWMTKANQKLVYYDLNQSKLFAEGRENVIFLSRVIPTPATIGYKQLSQLVITQINGKEVQSMDEVFAALQSPVDGFHQIEFENNPKQITLDTKVAEQANRMLQQRYGLPLLKR